MPLNIDFLQILLHLLNFVILAGGLSFLVYRPVRKFLEDRARHFEEMEQNSIKREEEAAKLQAEYEKRLGETEAELREQKKKAERELSELSARYVKEAQQKADAILLAAEHEAEERKDHILETAQAEISELVLSATEKLLHNTVTPERNRELYDEFIRLTDQSKTSEEPKA